MKTKMIIGVLALAELCLCLIVISPIFVNDRKYDQAFMMWSQNKTPENEAIWTREQARLQRQKMITRFSTGGLLLANTIGLLWVTKKTKHNAQQRAATYGS